MSTTGDRRFISERIFVERIFSVHGHRARGGVACALLVTLLMTVAWAGGLLADSAARERAAVAPPTDATTTSVSPQTNEQLARTAATPDAETRARVAEAYGRLPMRFEVNAGQHDRQVRYTARGSGYNLFLTPTEAVIALSTPAARAGRREPAQGRHAGSEEQPARARQAVVRMQLVDGNSAPQVAGEGEQAGTTNYFVGNDPSRWRTGVASFGRVRYREVYAGIDLVYYGNNQQLEYDFQLTPGADPAKIRLRFVGAERLWIEEGGELVLTVAGGGEVRQRRPVVYQEVGGERREVAGRYMVHGGREVGFHLGEYDRSLPLVIDPVLSYSTYLGGIERDFGYGIAVDSARNSYVTGLTASPNFPLARPLQQTFGGNSDAFVAKINASGSALFYSTYFGGNDLESGHSIAVDVEGHAYVTGVTSSSDFPLVNPLQPNPGGFADAFVTKINAEGTSLVYSTYLGGSSYEEGRDIAVDTAGNTYVTGETRSTNFPLANPLQPIYGGAADAFVTNINAAGTSLVYSTYVGGDNIDSGDSIAVDSAGSAYLAGMTLSPNFPTARPLQPTYRGGGDAFVAKISARNPAFVFSTYLGGSSHDRAYGIAVDSAGSAYVTGGTGSADFPLASPLQPTLRGSGDAFITRMNASGSVLVYSTYFGGGGSDTGFGIAVDSAGSAYVTGGTGSADFPLASPLQPTFGGGFADAFVTKLAAGGTSLIYSTYLGGSGFDGGRGITVDSAGNAYIIGDTPSRDFPLRNPLQPTHGGGTSDVFVARIGDTTPPPDPIRVALSRDASGQLVATITITNPLDVPVLGVQLTLVRASTLDGSAFVDGVPVPQTLGTINPGQSVTALVTFPGTEGVPPGLAGLVRVELSYTGGTYGETKHVTTPGFTFADFCSATGLNFVGDARQSTCRLRLTPSASEQKGAVWYITKQDVRGGFETTFRFQITDLGGIPGIDLGADGLAFVVQNNSVSAIGLTAEIGPGMGYHQIPNSLAVEFDTYHNIEHGDPNANHISVHTLGTAPNSHEESASIGRTTTIPNLSDGNVHIVRITYVPGTMNIFIDDLSTPALTVNVNLDVLGLDDGRAYMGFTAATGSAWENHDILSWSHTPSGTVPIPAVTVEAGDGL